MIMMFGSAAEMMETQSPEWITEMIGFMRDLDKELHEAGELVFDEGLAGRRHAKIVRLIDGVPVTTDGPFAEAKESLIGFWVLDVADEARILEIAGRIVKYSGRRRGPPPGRAAGRVTRRTDQWIRGPAARAGAAGPRHRSYAGTASSTRARTRSRRRCSRRPSSGRRTGVPDSPRPGWSPSPSAG